MFSLCPYCQSDEIEGSSFTVTDNSAYQECFCIDCNRSYTDVYDANRRLNEGCELRTPAAILYQKISHEKISQLRDTFSDTAYTSCSPGDDLIMDVSEPDEYTREKLTEILGSNIPANISFLNPKITHILFHP